MPLFWSRNCGFSWRLELGSWVSKWWGFRRTCPSRKKSWDRTDICVQWATIWILRKNTKIPTLTYHDKMAGSWAVGFRTHVSWAQGAEFISTSVRRIKVEQIRSNLVWGTWYSLGPHRVIFIRRCTFGLGTFSAVQNEFRLHRFHLTSTSQHRYSFFLKTTQQVVHRSLCPDPRQREAFLLYRTLLWMFFSLMRRLRPIQAVNCTVFPMIVKMPNAAKLLIRMQFEWWCVLDNGNLFWTCVARQTFSLDQVSFQLSQMFVLWISDRTLHCSLQSSRWNTLALWQKTPGRTVGSKNRRSATLCSVSKGLHTVLACTNIQLQFLTHALHFCQQKSVDRLL